MPIYFRAFISGTKVATCELQPRFTRVLKRFLLKIWIISNQYCTTLERGTRYPVCYGPPYS